MSSKLRILILVVLGLVIAGILVYPNLGPVSKEGFAVTPNPADSLAEVKGKGKPVFLEFYAAW